MDEADDIKEQLVRVVAEKRNCDILFYNGSIDRPFDFEVIKLIGARRKRENLLLFLVTSGGDAHAAYRIARCIQENYKKFTVFVPGWCKSAGTLVVIGAHEIVMGENAELGPIDVQRAKQDELWESSSGLTEDAAIETLENAALKVFEHYLFDIKEISGGQITFKTASEVASILAVGLFEPIFAQIDPLKIGENARAMKIASDYGLRLAVNSKSLKSKNSMKQLVEAYSSHGFVIDRAEASRLFTTVSAPDDDLERLCECMGNDAHYPPPQNERTPEIQFLNVEDGTSDVQSAGEQDGANKPPTAEAGGRAPNGASVDTSGNTGGSTRPTPVNNQPGFEGVERSVRAAGEE